MGGFKNQEIEVEFAGEVYKIQLDPPIEMYRQLLSLMNKKMNNKEIIEEAKNLTTDMICLNNPNVNRDNFFKSLTIPAALKFLNAYADLLYKGSGLKNSSSPLSQPEKESKEEKK